MRPHARLLATAIIVLSALSACDRPSYIELEPKDYTFKRAGEDVWWHARAHSRNGTFLQRVTVRWTSSDPKVATVDSVGRVRAVGHGHATIVAKVGSVQAEARVEVQAVGKVTAEPTEGLTLNARGEPKTLTMAVLDPAGHPMADRHAVARCESEEICRVFGDKVYGVDSGETTLTVSCEGSTAQIPIKVLPTEEERLAKGIGVDGPRRGAARR